MLDIFNPVREDFIGKFKQASETGKGTGE